MMKLLLLFYEFAKVGLFSVGGGLATVPFLQSMGEKTGWFTNAQLSTMIAVSESTPGPMGVNMATYVGYSISGIPGAIIATLGLITPSIAVIIIIAGFLQKFRQSKTVDAVFAPLPLPSLPRRGCRWPCRYFGLWAEAPSMKFLCTGRLFCCHW